jgi:urease gamma subunit
MKDEMIKVRLPKAEKDSLVAVAELMEVPASQIVRKAVKKEVALLVEQIEVEKMETLEVKR